MADSLLSTSTSTITSTALNGVISTPSGTIEYTGGTEVRTHTIKARYMNDMQCYIKNTGNDNIVVRIAIQLTEKGNEIDVVPSIQLAPNEDLLFSYSKPCWYLYTYITPGSSSSSWVEEYIVRWQKW